MGQDGHPVPHNGRTSAPRRQPVASRILSRWRPVPGEGNGKCPAISLISMALHRPGWPHCVPIMRPCQGVRPSLLEMPSGVRGSRCGCSGHTRTDEPSDRPQRVPGSPLRAPRVGLPTGGGWTSGDPRQERRGLRPSPASNLPGSAATSPWHTRFPSPRGHSSAFCRAPVLAHPTPRQGPWRASQESLRARPGRGWPPGRGGAVDQGSRATVSRTSTPTTARNAARMTSIATLSALAGTTRLSWIGRANTPAFRRVRTALVIASASRPIR